MKPYAYSISNYDDHHVFSTLEKSVEYMKSVGFHPCPKYIHVYEHYENGEMEKVDSNRILDKVELTDDRKIELLNATKESQKYWIGTVMELEIIERTYSELVEQNSWKWK